MTATVTLPPFSIYGIIPLAQLRMAVNFLKDADRARAYVNAREEAADAIRSRLVWRMVGRGATMTHWNDITVVRHLAAPGSPGEGVLHWGTVSIGRAFFPIECEDQMIAYLVARFVSFTGEQA